MPQPSCSPSAPRMFQSAPTNHCVRGQPPCPPLAPSLPPKLELVPGGAKPPGPVGMLTVRLVRIAGLRSEDMIGQSDPYVVVQAGGGCLLVVSVMGMGVGDDFSNGHGWAGSVLPSGAVSGPVCRCRSLGRTACSTSGVACCSAPRLGQAPALRLCKRPSQPSSTPRLQRFNPHSRSARAGPCAAAPPTTTTTRNTTRRLSCWWGGRVIKCTPF
jgi:hypothetical protein